MNGRKAKELRRKVYGEGSKRNEKQYSKDEKGTIYCVGKRVLYLKLKKEEVRKDEQKSNSD
jgi:hypothetical protein